MATKPRSPFGDFLKKTLGSRNFWVTLSGVIAAVTAGDLNSAFNLIMVYIAAQGTIDAVAAFKAK